MRATEKFLEQVRELLVRLYDYPYLQRCTLGEILCPANLDPRERMRHLRTLTLKLIEGMNPGNQAPQPSSRRSYEVLKLHYVDGLTMQEVARELAVSERQAYRSLRRAEKELAELLWEHRVSSKPLPSSPELEGDTRARWVASEAERASSQFAFLNVCKILETVFSFLGRLAANRRVELELVPCDELPEVFASQQAVRQTLLSTLSYVIQHARPGTRVCLRALRSQGNVCLKVDFVPDQDPGKDLELPDVAQELVRRIGGELALVKEGEHTLVRCVLRAVSNRLVLLIDDNEGMIELVQRYLADSGYRLLAARNGRDGLQLARSKAPDVIILDIMMPEQDGWETLQWLQTLRETRSIPILICSVIDDPELAHSLGAAEHLTKPFSRQELLSALERCVSAEPAPAP